ncbi:MAG TPA: fatty acid desaturase, partial [Phenylobacterium sp.]|nr:fatty acid desaturase [Phenylobacterium sp.]
MPNPDTRPWRQRLAPYQQPSARRSILEIVITAAPLAAIWGVAWVAAHFGLWWVALLLTVPAALFLVRLFMVQHDCSHRAFFRNRHANDWIGRVIGVLTVTPY